MFSHKVLGHINNQHSLSANFLPNEIELLCFPNSSFKGKQTKLLVVVFEDREIASYEFKMKNWFPFPMTSKGKTFMKSKCGASMLCSPRQEKWKKKTSSTRWKHCERGSSCRINFSHSFLLIIAYLIIEVAAFQQNLGRKGEKLILI